MTATCCARQTWLYYIQVGDDGPIKIGLADDPPDRLNTLQQGNAGDLYLRVVEWPACRHHEQRRHDQFADARLRGEWFTPTPELLAHAGEQAWLHGMELRVWSGETTWAALEQEAVAA